MAWYDPTSWLAKAEAPSPAPNTPAAAAEQVPLTSPIGSTGLKRAGGFVDEELLVKLSGRRAARVYREMSDNSAVVGAVIYIVEMLLRQVEWRVEPAGELPRQLEAKKFLDECFEDMEHTWDEFLAEVLSMLPYGWSYFEHVLKLRRGPDSEDPCFRSRFSDGRIGIRKLSIRAQDTLDRWEFAKDGTALGWYQQDPYSGQSTVYLPLHRGLLFRTTSRKSSPEGRSCLRNSYRSWWMAKRIEEIEAIGIERDLAGLPVIELPLEFMSTAATPAQQLVRASYQSLVQQIRRDEREGIVMPSSVKADGQPSGYKLSLLAAGGRSKAIDTSPVVVRHEQRIAMTMLAEFIFLGTGSVGSWSLASTKTNLFAKALGGHMENIASVLNRQLVPRLMALNGFTPDEYPSVVHGDVEAPPLEEIATAINQLVGAGVLTPDEGIERKLREMAKLPELENEAQPAPEKSTAVNSLRAAIERHERHMNGTEPTSEASQMKMMDEMKASLAAMTGTTERDVPPPKPAEKPTPAPPVSPAPPPGPTDEE